MALTRQTLEIYYEDGREDTVQTDQRDQVALEKRYKIGFLNALDDMPMQSWRFLGWAALRRTGSLEGVSFDDWDKTIIAVEPEGDEQPVDPTQPGASATV